MENWGKNTKMAVWNEIMHTNGGIFFLKESYDDTFWKKKIWNPQMKNRRNFDGRIVQIQKSKIEKLRKWTIFGI